MAIDAKSLRKAVALLPIRCREAIVLCDLESQSYDEVGSVGLCRRTGLTGSYRFNLEWTPDNKQTPDSAGPFIFTALQEQLGLKLETGEAPLDILIIDHAEKPSEN